MPVVLSCPSCQAQLKLKSEPPPGAVARCPRCHGAVPLAPASDGTRTFPPTNDADSADPQTRLAQPRSASGPSSTGDDRGDSETRAHQPRAGRALPPDTGFLAPPEAPDEIGRLGPYRVLDHLGAGGMGVVFRAEDPMLRRQVALKVLLPQYASNEMWKARFLREAHAQAAVEHAHVVTIYDANEYEGVAYIAMQLLKGQTLGAALKQNPRPPLKDVLRLGREAAEGLAAAHGVGLIHRDIKPANLWLDTRRRLKILDFGLARTADAVEPTGDAATEAHSGATADGPLTVQGAVVGTPVYMSPEQARGEKVDHRTDLWSLGVVLYQMTTGKLPFTGPTLVAIREAVEGLNPPAPRTLAPDLPEPVSDLIVRLLKKRAAERPPSAEAVAEELRRLETAFVPAVSAVATPVAAPDDPWSALEDDEASAAGEVVSTRRAVRAPEARSAPRWWPLAVVAACAALLAVAAVALVLGGKRTPPSPEPEPVAADHTPAVKPHAPKVEKEPPPGPLPTGVPLPAQAEVAAAAERARARFAAEYAKPGTDGRLALGAALEAAGRAAAQPADRYALWLEARDAYAAAGAVEPALKVCDHLADVFVVNRWELKVTAAAVCLKTLEQMPANGRAPALLKLATLSREAARSADDADALTPAVALFTTAHAAAALLPQPDLAKDIQAELTDAQTAQAAATRAAAGTADPATYTAAGKRLAVRFGHWPEAVRFLAKGEGPWRTAAEAEAGLSAPQLDPAKAFRHFDFTTGKPGPGGPEPGKNGDKCEWSYTPSALAIKSRRDLPYFCTQSLASFPHEIAIEVRARVTSDTGAWVIDPLGYGVSGVFLSIDHLGAVRVRGWGQAQAFPPRVVSHPAVKGRGAWNTLLLVVRDNRLDLYVNGEAVAFALPLPPVAAKVSNLFIGSEGDAEYERATIWTLDAVPPPRDTASAVSAGDRWWQAADAETDARARDAARRRAAHWYALAVEHLTGDAVARRDELAQRIRNARPLPDLSALPPLVRLDYSAGVTAGGPVPRKDPDGRYEWWQGKAALSFKTTGGTWWAFAGAVPREAAVEVRARVVSDNGGWVINPHAYPSPITEGTAGALVSVDHTGALSIYQYKAGKRQDEFPTRVIRHPAIKKRGEWNTVLVVMRDEKMDVYVNGEQVASGIALWGVPQKRLTFGIVATGAAEAEYERVTLWDLTAAPKK